MQNSKLIDPHFGKFRGKIKILSTQNLLCRKFASVCRKIATFCPVYYFNPRRRCTPLSFRVRSPNKADGKTRMRPIKTAA